MEFYLILGNTKAMVFIWEGGDLRLNEKEEKNTVHKWLIYHSLNVLSISINIFCFPATSILFILAIQQYFRPI